MNITVIGILKQTTNYQDWYACFHRQICNVPICEIHITGGNTVLNRYVKRYAKSMSIPVKEYHLDESTEHAQVKLARNKALIRDADLVVACMDDQIGAEKSDTEIGAIESTKKAIIITVTEQTKSKRNMKESQEVNRDQLITLEEEVALIKQIQQSPDDCEAAKQKLLLANRRFVRAIVERYADESRSAAELIAEGNKGLLHAAEKYDASKGFKFISYAQYWIKTFIEQDIMNNPK